MMTTTTTTLPTDDGAVGGGWDADDDVRRKFIERRRRRPNNNNLLFLPPPPRMNAPLSVSVERRIEWKCVAIEKIIHIDETTLVFAARLRGSSSSSSSASASASDDLVVVVRIAIDDDEDGIRHRAGMEYIAAFLPNVPQQYGFRVYIRGADFVFADLFATSAPADEIEATMAASPTGFTLTAMLALARNGSVLVTYSEYMRGGDLSATSRELRRGLEAELRRIFINTLMTEAKRMYGQFIYHQDLVARNIVRDGNRLALIDFEHAEFTDDEAAMHELIRLSVRRIVNMEPSVGQAAQTLESRLRPRQRNTSTLIIKH
jgi:hypothetical protein